MADVGVGPLEEHIVAEILAPNYAFAAYKCGESELEIPDRPVASARPVRPSLRK
jgi:hypothetical protein